MAKFEVGTKVKAKAAVLCDHHGEVGVIVDANETGYPVDVEFDDGIIEGFEEYELELAPSEPAASAPTDADGSGAVSFTIGQKVILLDGTSLVGKIIGRSETADAYKVAIEGSTGRWYDVSDLAVSE